MEDMRLALGLLTPVVLVVVTTILVLVFVTSIIDSLVPIE
jgi:hypothetical protein